mmetsp:Transcript_34084/g.61441  ORF Transcript_34084/g.61441 Transcript_34084/m.61441 type:complete len:97 (+) Transcript_34084:35-325(+)
MSQTGKNDVPLKVSKSLFGQGYPAQAASIDYAKASGKREPINKYCAPHLLSSANQQADLLLAYHTFSEDLSIKQEDETRTRQRSIIGALLNKDSMP